MGDKDWTHGVPGCTSQSNEDLIIADIFREIGETNKRFVEFGSGDGRQNNTIALLKRGWSGIWCEPHKRRFESAKERFKKYPVEILRRVVTPEKVNVIVKDPLDFLSIDIDGGDYDVWQAVQAKPRVVCIELLGKPPVVETTWRKGYRFGRRAETPLDIMRALGESKGYRYHCLSDSLVNAFFILEDQ